MAPDGTPLPYPEEEAGAAPPGLLEALMGGPAPVEEAPVEEAVASSDPASILREMLEIAREYASVEQDDEDLLAMEKVTTLLQQLLANQQKERDAAMGVSPQMKAMRRASRV